MAENNSVPCVQEERSAEPVDTWTHSEDPPVMNHFLEILLRRKWVILMFLFAAFAAMTVVTLNMPWTYKGEASIEVAPLAPNVTTFAEVMSNSSPGDEYTRTQAAILKNRGLASRVIEKLHMDKNPAFNFYLAKKNPGVIHRIKETVVERASRLFHGKLPPSKVLFEQREALMDAFDRDLDVQSTPGTNIITVAFSSTEPSLAKEAANQTVDEFMNWQVDRYIDATRFAKARLEKQIDLARGRLEKSQSQLDKYARQWGIVSLASGSNLALKQLDVIDQALVEMEANRIAKSAYYLNAQKSDPGSLQAVQQSNMIGQLQNEYTALASKYEQLRLVYKDNSPKLQELKAQIAFTESEIDLEEKKILDGIRQDYVTSIGTEQALEAVAQKKRTLALDFNDKIENYKTLQTQVKTNREVYMSLLKRCEEIDANVGTQLGNVKVLSRSPLPVAPYKPNLPLNFLIALVLGVAGGVGTAFILENSDTTVKSVGEVSPRDSTRILGVVPFVGRAGGKRLAERVLTEPDAIFSEAIRFARTLIELSSATGAPVRSMLIASAEPNAGKSTVAASLALAFASCAKDRVLLIDADLSAGEQHKKNEGKRPAGLSDYLSGRCTLDTVLCGAQLPNLFSISSGCGADSTGGLLHLNEIKKLMLELTSRFDRIIVDGQPLGSNTLALAKMVDAVIFVAAIGRTHRKSLQIFQQSMSNVGANVLGVIVNKYRVNRYDYHSCYYQSSSRRSPVAGPRSSSS
ncbi:MAG: polysaccharide biosynthesis tyrosine autokinase [Syntrophobacteraceae bacterium]|nr:polysaccharide biosynthesis tyrosine autokinase [Syntrophobacteraceae bacterium]